MLRLRLASMFVLASISACGGGGGSDANSGHADAAPDGPLGPGSNNLLVEGTFVVQNPNNLSVGSSLMVFCDLRISKAGAPVADAVVIVNPAPPAFQAVLTGDEVDLGHYRGTYFAYADTARLTVTTLAHDYINEAVLVGPKLFQIEMPQMGVGVPPTSPLHVSWGQPGGAVDWADVALESGFSMTDLPDNGSYDIPAASLVPGEDTAQVTRWSHDVIPGAAPGSYIDFGIHDSQPFSVVN